MPRLDHRKLENVLFPFDGAVAALQGDTEDAVRRRGSVKKALTIQMVSIERFVLSQILCALVEDTDTCFIKVFSLFSMGFRRYGEDRTGNS